MPNKTKEDIGESIDIEFREIFQIVDNYLDTEHRKEQDIFKEKYLFSLESQEALERECIKESIRQIENILNKKEEGEQK